jgi:hypothetical protein
MARPIVTVPPVTILMEMAGYGSLTEWMARPLPKEDVAALSLEARRERKRAQVRACKAQRRGDLESAHLRISSATLSLVFVGTSGKFLLTISHHIL